MTGVTAPEGAARAGGRDGEAGQPVRFAQALDLRVLRYSRVWEDHRLLERGLAPDGDSDVLMIAGAGCNVLNLLLAGPRSITAVDVSPTQLALLELLLVAIARCPGSRVRQLLGVAPGGPDERVAAYTSVRDGLTTSARALWDGRIGDIAGGLAFSGRLERYITGFTQQVLPAHVPVEELARLFTLDDPCARREWVDRWLEGTDLESAFRSWFSRDEMAAKGRDPVQLAWVGDVDVPGQLWERLRWVCTALPTRENFYLHAFLFGAYGEALPPYLTDEGLERLRPLLVRVHLHAGEIADIVSAWPPGAFSHAALSDIFEYSSPRETTDALTLLGTKLRRRGRVAFWNLFVPRAPGCDVPSLTRLDGLSDELIGQDRSWFYRSFHVAEVEG